MKNVVALMIDFGCRCLGGPKKLHDDSLRANQFSDAPRLTPNRWLL